MKYYMESERGRWWLMKEGPEKAGIMLFAGEKFPKRQMAQLCDWLNNVPVLECQNYLEINE